MGQIELWGGMRSEAFRFLDQEVVFLNQPVVGRAVYQALAQRGLGSLGDLLSVDVRRRFARQESFVSLIFSESVISDSSPPMA